MTLSWLPGDHVCQYVRRVYSAVTISCFRSTDTVTSRPDTKVSNPVSTTSPATHHCPFSTDDSTGELPRGSVWKGGHFGAMLGHYCDTHEDILALMTHQCVEVSFISLHAFVHLLVNVLLLAVPRPIAPPYCVVALKCLFLSDTTPIIQIYKFDL